MATKEQRSKLIQGLKDYLDNTSPEQLEMDWKELEQFNQYGPDMEECLELGRQHCIETMKEMDKAMTETNNLKQCDMDYKQKHEEDNMITEDYCPQEVVQLLREKGFPVGVGSWSRGFVWDGEGYLPGLVKHENSITHQMAMKWLREEHKIDIFIDTDFPIDRMKYTYKIVRIYKDGDKYTDVMGGSFDTYEEAVEAALKHCLTELI